MAEYDEVDMGEVGEVDSPINDPIKDMIDAIAAKNFNQASDTFNSLISDKLNTALDQERVNVASQIFNDDEDDDEEEDTDVEMSDEDLEDEEGLSDEELDQLIDDEDEEES